MRYLFSRAGQAVVARLARERTLCAFDFDGTLAPIVEHPADAGMRGETRQLLRRLATLYPSIVVSGRSRADILPRLKGIKLARVIGNHGAEIEATPPESGAVPRWKRLLDRKLASLPGVWVEQKGTSLAVHYRQSPNKSEARSRIWTAAESLPMARVYGGKQVVNVVMQEAPHKGDAVSGEQHRLHCELALYVGDDENDEDAFALGDGVVAVRVGREPRSKAAYYLRSQEEVDELLKRLIAQRNRPALPRERRAGAQRLRRMPPNQEYSD